MLAHLHIQNVGLIEQCEVSFKKGFTIITGETGAGKSMLIDALSLGLGVRADTSLIRHGAEMAMVEVRFEIEKNHPCISNLEEMGLKLEGGELFLRRSLSRDKSRAFINGSQVTQSQLQAIGGKLVDIHGQYDGQLILKPTHHLNMLDHFGRLDSERSHVQKTYETWHVSYHKLLNAQNSLKTQAEEEILLTAYIDELQKLNVEKGEEEKLTSERKLLMSSEKIATSLNEAIHTLSGDVDICNTLGQAESTLSSISDISEELSELYKRLNSVSLEVSEVVNDIERMGAGLEASPERLKEVDDRLFTLKDCARKHGVAMDNLPEKLEEMIQRLEDLKNLQSDLTELEKEVVSHRKIYEAACKLLTKSRLKASEKLSVEVEKSLVFLEMPQTKFEAHLQPLNSEDWTEKGAERIEFMVATNKGQPLAPLVKVASGGEVSRLMLALKQVFYKNISETTLVFDEIDTGVGGHVAEAMGLAMKDLSNKHQVFSITHLAQVASKGHRHVKIVKKTENETTRTNLAELNNQERLEEVSRMLSGKEITKEASAAAAKLLAS